jgi:transcriptional regulator with XRE-family HTH domain
MAKLPVFARRVTLEREKRRLSQQELAAMAGVSYQTIWRIEHGKHKEPGIYVARKIARALSVSLDYLVGLYEEDGSVWPPGTADACRLTAPADQMHVEIASGLF